MQITTAMREAATVIPLAFVGFTGCVDLNQMQKRLDTIEENQKTILSKLDEIKKGGGAAGATPTAAARQAMPGRPDPAKVYAVSDDGQQKGPSSAWVTIVESSEFQ